MTKVTKLLHVLYLISIFISKSTFGMISHTSCLDLHIFNTVIHGQRVAIVAATLVAIAENTLKLKNKTDIKIPSKIEQIFQTDHTLCLFTIIVTC